MKLFIFKKKTIFITLMLFILVCVFCLTYFSINPTSTPKYAYSIVIDAGHGGIDGGCIGVSTGVKESELNLKYAKKLRDLCGNAGLKVVMTRTSDDGLYSPFAQNKKKSEMEKREQIIKSSNADLFVSIHMNSMTNHNLSGAQVFYKIGNEVGKIFADSITTSIKDADCKIRGGSKEGDYYVLNCHNMAGVLIECGYLSNEEEEMLLISENYLSRFCDSVLKGILNFLKM